MKYLLLIIPILLLSSCGKVITEEQAKKHCESRWQVVWSVARPFLNFDQDNLYFNVSCTARESDYEKCLRIMRNTFSDLSDTWGNNTNNQDSISKTMSAEIDRCLTNIK